MHHCHFLSWEIQNIKDDGRGRRTKMASASARLTAGGRWTAPLRNWKGALENRPCRPLALAQSFSSTARLSWRNRQNFLCTQASNNASLPTSEAGNVTMPSPGAVKENWAVKMLFDGDCPLCMREVNMLRERNKIYGTIRFVDITAVDYSPEENAGVDFATAMGRIHAILPDGTILYDIMAFKKLYEEVGLGWVYAFTKIKSIAKIADAIYSIWAKYRLPITGRPPLIQILEARQKAKEVCGPGQCRID